MLDSNNLALRIKQLAKQQGISAKQLLEDCELNKNALYHMQTGGYYPRMEAFVKIADRLNVSLDYLMARTEETGVESTLTAVQREAITLICDLPDEKIEGLLQLLRPSNP